MNPAHIPGPYKVHHGLILARGSVDTWDGPVWGPIAQALPQSVRREGREWSVVGDMQASLRVMAAGPSLLSALQALVAKSTDRDGDWSAEWRNALNAIAEAGGSE